MVIMAVGSAVLIALVFGFTRYNSHGVLELKKSFIITVIIISIVIGAIISGIDALIEMMTYHEKG